jgi:hypothetical protein
MNSKQFASEIVDKYKGSTQHITRISKHNFNRVRKNSIEEGNFGVLDGYHQMAADMSKNKRSLRNRRQKEKPSINMLKNEHSIEQTTNNETPTASKVNFM